MTITDADTLARDEAAITLARQTITTLTAAGIDAAAEWADLQLAGGKPATWVLHRLIDANRLIAKGVRGEPATP